MDEKLIAIDRHQEQKQHTLKCPRCDSCNTKFCYYNNYNLSQPRHFCKSCKRYWTKGGTLRNVPVGGGSRKNRKIKIPQPTNPLTAAATKNPNLDHLSSLPQNPNYHMFNTLVSGCDFSQPQISNLGLGFSTSTSGAGIVANHPQNSSLFLSSYPSSIFAYSTSTSTSAPTMASLFSSGFQQQQRYIDWSSHFLDQNNDDHY